MYRLAGKMLMDELVDHVVESFGPVNMEVIVNMPGTLLAKRCLTHGQIGAIGWLSLNSVQQNVSVFS